jgi:peptidoglycan/LPS O-acetylase OafA/YrhL
LKSKLSPGEKSKIYFPQLDSIRGISFIAIFLFHTLRINYGVTFLGDFTQYLFANLPLAIDVFFILSSFLLTYLALNEYQKRGNFSFQNYFTRRILRIWPLYYFILLLAFILFPVVASLLHYKMTLPEPVYYIFFIANFYTINHVFFLRLLWTISVEEQFYLLWGFCLRFFHKHLYKIIFILIFVSVVFSIYSTFTQSASYFNSLTYLFDFGCGALAALLTFKNKFIIACFRNLAGFKTIFYYCYLPFHFIFFYILNKHSAGISNDLVALANRYLFIIYIGLFIIEQMINIRRTKILERSRFLIFTGKISYGLYCYHGISIMFLNLLVEHFNLGISNWIMVLISFALNYFVAIISYFYLESPFLKLKAKWRRI